MATIKDVARLAGVSVSTVSIVLNTSMEERRVSPKTWLEVQNAIETLNYRPSRAARKLRKNEKTVPSIGVFWPINYHSSMIGDALVSIQNAFDRAYFACNVIVYMFQPKQLSEYQQLMEDGSLDGAVIGLAYTEDLEWLEKTELKLPVVMFNRQVNRCNFVRSDNRNMGRRAAQLLIEACCKNAALFHTAEYGRGVERRLSDFKGEFPNYKEYAFQQEENYEQIIAQTEAMLENGLPEAVVYFCSERAAYASLSYLIKKQVRIPEDMKAILVGMNASGLFRYLSPTMTVVTAPVQEMLSDCVQILISQLKRADKIPIHKIYAPEVYYGETLPKTRL